MPSPPSSTPADPARLRAALLRYVRSRVADPTTAEDLVHDIFVRATRELPSITQVSSPHRLNHPQTLLHSLQILTLPSPACL